MEQVLSVVTSLSTKHTEYNYSAEYNVDYTQVVHCCHGLEDWGNNYVRTYSILVQLNINGRFQIFRSLIIFYSIFFVFKSDIDGVYVCTSKQNLWG